MVGRAGRGFSGGGEDPFSVGQRIYLLERDLDENDVHLDEIREEMKAIRKMVTNRLNVLVGIGFSLLLSVVAVLITVIASQR